MGGMEDKGQLSLSIEFANKYVKVRYWGGGESLLERYKM